VLSKLNIQIHQHASPITSLNTTFESVGYTAPSPHPANSVLAHHSSSSSLLAPSPLAPSIRSHGNSRNVASRMMKSVPKAWKRRVSRCRMRTLSTRVWRRKRRRKEWDMTRWKEWSDSVSFKRRHELPRNQLTILTEHRVTPLSSSSSSYSTHSAKNRILSAGFANSFQSMTSLSSALLTASDGSTVPE